MKPLASLLFCTLLLPAWSIAQEPSKLASRFQELDANQDGVVTKEEMPRPLLFKKLDADGNGSITLEEAKANFASQPETPEPDLVIKKDVAYGEHAPQKLDLYAPEGAENAPVMIYIHGGGWMKGDKKAVGEKPEFFSNQGWLFISANYRLLPDGRHPANAEDVAAAVAWVHDNVAKVGGNPDQIFIMGHSAGCHLVSLVATDGRHLEKVGKSLDVVKGVIALDTQGYDIPALMEGDFDSEIYKRVFTEDPEKQQDASPSHFIAPDKDIPPFFITYSAGMGQRPNSQRGEVAEAFAAKLREAGMQAEVADGSDRNHGQINQWFGKPDDAKVTGKALAFLKGILVEGDAEL